MISLHGSIDIAARKHCSTCMKAMLLPFERCRNAACRVTGARKLNPITPHAAPLHFNHMMPSATPFHNKKGSPGCGIQANLDGLCFWEIDYMENL